MRTKLTIRTTLMLMLSPAVVATGCGENNETEDTGSSCAGGKCDDVDPADFACKELQNLTSRDSQNVLTELHDPFAQKVLKLGAEGCPTTYREVMAKLRETDNQGCEDAGSGLRTRLVSEDDRSARGVITRACDGRTDHELVFSIFGATEQNLPSSVEVMGFDPETKEFNYYTVEGGEVAFHGSSTDILTGAAGRCKNCHTGGGMVMKELRNPWIHWDTHEGFDNLVDNFSDDLGRSSGGSNMENINKKGNDAWNETRVTLLTNEENGFTVKDMLRPLFCGSEFNLDTGAASSFSGLSSLPQNLFAHCKLFGGSCMGTHFGESGGVDMPKEVYEAAIADAGQQVPQRGGADTAIAMPFLEPAVGDIDYVDRLVDAGVLDDDFVLDVVAIDFTRPVFSDARCDLLEFAPEWDELATAPDPEPETGGDSDGGTDGGTDGSDSGEPATTGAGGTTGASPAGPGNCCEDQSAAGGKGCENSEIEACVCAADSFCCDNTWDSVCVGVATDQCEVMCPRSAEFDAGPAVVHEATVESIRAGFIANLQAASPAEGTPEAQLLSALQNAEDAENHTGRVSSFMDACRARDQRALMDDVLQYVTLQRRTARQFHVMEFPATMPDTDLQPPAGAHLDPSTCELSTN